MQLEWIRKKGKKATPFFVHAFMIAGVTFYTIIGAIIIQYLETTPVGKHGLHASNTPRNINQRSLPILRNPRDMAVNKECLDKALRISMNEICSDSNIKVENILDSIDDCYSALTTSKSVENFNLVEKMVADEDGNLVLHQFEEWSFSDSLLFCYTVVTTIGYGNVAPKSFGGRLFCIFYGLFGIPFTLLAIADLGKFISEIMATTTKVYGAFWRRMRRRLRKIKFSHPLLNCIIQQAFGKSNNTSAQNSTFRLDKIDDDLEKGYFEEDEKPLTSIPDDTNNNKRKESNQSDSIISCDDKIGIIASEEDNKKDTDKKENEEDDEEEEKGAYTNQACSLMGFFIIYLIVGSVLLSTYEPNMTFFNALYFAFVSLSSIGLGDIVPKSQQYLLFTIIYISIGLALTTIAIDIAADYLKKLHYFGRKIENVASVTIWFGGKKLTMGQLVRNLGDQFNLPIHTIKSLDLDEFVDKAIKVEAGELESLRPPAIQPEMLNTLIDSVGFADGDDEWPGGNEQDNWESPIREKIVTPPRALTPIIFKNSSPLPRSPTPPPKSPTPPPPRIPTPPPPTPPPRTPTPPPKIPSPPPKSPTPPRIPTPEPVKVKTPELTKKEKPRQLTAAELEEQKRKAYSEDAWKRYQEYQKQWKKLRQVKTDYKPGASSSSKRSLQNSPAMSVVAEEAQKQMHKQKSLQVVDKSLNQPSSRESTKTSLISSKFPTVSEDGNSSTTESGCSDASKSATSTIRSTSSNPSTKVHPNFIARNINSTLNATPPVRGAPRRGRSTSTIQPPSRLQRPAIRKATRVNLDGEESSRSPSVNSRQSSPSSSISRPNSSLQKAPIPKGKPPSILSLSPRTSTVRPQSESIDKSTKSSQ